MDPAAAHVAVLDPSAPPEARRGVLEAASALHPSAALAEGDGWAAVVVGDGARPVEVGGLSAIPAVVRLAEVRAPYRLASREVFPERCPVAIGPELSVGAEAPLALTVRWAGPDVATLIPLLAGLREAGAVLLHVDAAPGGDEAAELGEAARAHGLAFSVEVGSGPEIATASEIADALEVGGASMQDFSLLRDLGHADRPVVLRRGPGATAEEFLLAAEYVLQGGNGRVILCESGIRTFDSGGRPRFEINAIPLLAGATHLPVLADPSTAARAELVPALARAAVAAGADGVLLEVGTGTGAIEPGRLGSLAAELRAIARAVGRRG